MIAEFLLFCIISCILNIRSVVAFLVTLHTFASPMFWIANSLNNFRLRALVKTGLDSPHFTVSSVGWFRVVLRTGAKIKPILVCKLCDLHFHLYRACSSSYRQFELLNIKLKLFWALEKPQTSMCQGACCLTCLSEDCLDITWAKLWHKENLGRDPFHTNHGT